MAILEQDLPYSYSDECLAKSAADFVRRLNTLPRVAAALVIAGVTYGSMLAGVSMASESAPITPIPRSGLEPNAPQSEYTLLFNEVASRTATQDQILEYNRLVLQEITVKDVPQITGLTAVQCVVDTGKKDNPEDFRSGIGHLDINNNLVNCE